MDILQAILLGIVQGVTEFLPVSSSGHLVLAPWLLGWEYQGLSFDVAVHVGTLIGVVGYFWKEWREIIMSIKSYVGVTISHIFHLPTRNGMTGADIARIKFFGFIVLATIPAALSGYLFDDYIEGAFRSPEIVAIALIIFSFVMLAGERFGKKSDDLAKLNLKKVLAIGIFQVFALVPGVSRAGATISAGLLLGLSRVDAAKFSFLLSAPIIFGAGMFKIPDILAQGIDRVFVIGVLVSAISGYFAIKFLFKFLEKWSYKPFVWYRIVLGLVILVMSMFGLAS
jgi:undecaprenyl-diphosphatase